VNESPKPYEIILMVSGAVLLIFSFLSWFEIGRDDYTAWSGGLLPLATLAPICGVVVAVHVAINRFGSGNLATSVGGFTWVQIHLVLALYAVLIMLGYLITEKFEADSEVGLWFCLLGAIGLVVGAVMEQQEEGAIGGGGGSPAPPQSF
jgi:hypothetical protein